MQIKAMLGVMNLGYGYTERLGTLSYFIFAKSMWV